MLGAMLWLLSFFGYVWYLVGRRGLPAAFAPLVTASAQTLFIFLAALLNVMEAAAWAAVLIGAALFIRMLVKRSRVPVCAELIALVAVCALLWLRYRGALLMQYDDFSHWGTMARYMLTFNRLPDAGAEVIGFQSYPPASALWIYYVCRFFGGGEGMMLAAQAWLVAAAALPLWGLGAQRRRFAAGVVTALVALAMLSVFQGTASLMVDNLIAAISAGAAAMALYRSEDGRSCVLWLAPVLSVCCLIKDSGILFAAVVFAMVVILRKRRGVKLSHTALLASAPVACRLLWLLHTRLAFPSAQSTRHALSIENFRHMGADKSIGDILDIGARLARALLSPDNQILQVLLLTLICCALGAAYRALVQKRRVRIAREALLLVGGAATALIYSVSLWCMYTFTLSLSNALDLVALERYASTCALFLYGLLAAYMITALNEADGIKPRRVAAMLCGVALVAAPYAVPSWRAGVPRLASESYSVPLRAHIQSLYEKRPLAEGEAAVIYAGDAVGDASFISYIARYQWLRADIKVVTSESLEPDTLTDVVYALADDEALAEAVNAHPAEVVSLD